ncbi:hypothetical protein AB0M00_19660 [Streptomyces chartreusis]|uniref:hypothetical protein n=1 Tax=Streptomyces chartreusis TaxID=1969 RepID=UPI003449A860
MSARTEVHAALMRAGYGAPGADRLLDRIEAEAAARTPGRPANEAPSKARADLLLYAPERWVDGGRFGELLDQVEAEVDARVERQSLTRAAEFFESHKWNPDRGAFSAGRDAGIAWVVGMLRSWAGAAEAKDTRGRKPQEGESTHRHGLPCEYPELLPCRCCTNRRPSDVRDSWAGGR